MKITNIFTLSLVSVLILLSSCLGNEATTDYTDWKAANEEFLLNAETETKDGLLVYEKIVPNWDRSVFVLMRWLNDRSETTGNLSPLSNSTVTLNYTLTNVEGDTIDRGASFRCQPNNMITGFWTAVTNMNEGDTVNVVMPYTAAYGIYGSGSIPPFSTLIFGIRLITIDKLF